MESLDAYKQKAAEFKPEPPARIDTPEPGALVFFDGKEYLSASRAAEETGYTQDYVGQLARSGTVLSRQVGNRWYVEHQAIVDHKKEKDSLLAAVQSESVGLARPVSSPVASVDNSLKSSHFGSEPLLNYYHDDGDLIPDTAKPETTPESVQQDLEDSEDTLDPTLIPIKRVYTAPPAPLRSPARPRAMSQAASAPRRMSPLLLLGAAATIIIVLSVGYVSILKQNSVYAVGGKVNEASIGALKQNAAGAFQWIEMSSNRSSRVSWSTRDRARISRDTL